VPTRELFRSSSSTPPRTQWSIDSPWDFLDTNWNLSYWDWSQDWENFEGAPVFDDESGFGGDGDENGEVTVGNGRCVTSGPFVDLKALYYDDQYQPHCLSRGFAKGTELAELTRLIQPESIDEVMQEKEFAHFAHKLESRAHKFISHSIRGDFSKYTGPYGI
jgi:tyrosinase